MDGRRVILHIDGLPRHYQIGEVPLVFTSEQLAQLLLEAAISVGEWAKDLEEM